MTAIFLAVAIIVGEDEPLQNLAGALANLHLEVKPDVVSIVDTSQKPRLWRSNLFDGSGTIALDSVPLAAPIPTRAGAPSSEETAYFVGHDPWTDHFARSRNVSIALARFARASLRARSDPPWIYFVDCDHRVVRGKGAPFRAELGAAKDDEIAFFQTHHEAMGGIDTWSEETILLGPGRMGRPWGTFYVARLDRNPRFSNRIHESIEEWWLDEMTHAAEDVWRPDYPLHEPRSVCEVIHYAGTKNFGKRHQRNVRLLELALEDDPEHVRSMGFLAYELVDKPGGVERVRELYARALAACTRDPRRRGWRSGEFLRLAITRIRCEAADLKPDAMLAIASDLERFELLEQATRVRETVKERWR